MVAACLSSCREPQPQNTPADELYSRLEQCVEQQLVLLGHQDDLFYGKNWNRWSAGEGSDIKAVTGDYPAILGVEIGGLELDREASIDKIPFEMIRRGIIEHDARGGIIAMSWHPSNPLTGGNSWDTSAEGPVEALLEGGSHHELFGEWLVRLGDFFDSLRDAEGRHIPIIWRPWHENVGGWFWWGVPYCGAESFKALWAETYRYLMQERKFDHLVWSFSPSYHANCPTVYEEYWPGDEMVDLVGADIYQYAPDEEFMASTREQLTRLVAFAREHGKIATLSETGVEAIPNTRWWSEVFGPAIEGQPIAYLLLWRNAWDREAHYYAPFEGEHSAEDFVSWIEAQQIGLLDDLNQLCK